MKMDYFSQNLVDSIKYYKMGIEVTSLRVLLYVDDLPEEFHNFSKREIMAFIEAIKDVWPKNMYERFWFDVEIDLRDKVDGLWSFVIHVVCYHMPDKSRRCEIHRNILDQILDRPIEIFPIILNRNPNDEGRLNDFRRHKIVITHVYE